MTKATTRIRFSGRTQFSSFPISRPFSPLSRNLCAGLCRRYFHTEGPSEQERDHPHWGGSCSYHQRQSYPSLLVLLQTVRLYYNCSVFTFLVCNYTEFLKILSYLEIRNKHSENEQCNKGNFSCNCFHFPTECRLKSKHRLELI